MALSLLPPPDWLVHMIMENCGDWAVLNPAALSADGKVRSVDKAAGRRRIRNRAKRRIWRQIRHDPYMPLVREWLLKRRRDSEKAGYTGDPARIGKLRDKEVEISERFQDSLQSNDLPENLAPIVKGNPDALNLLWEFAVYGGATVNKVKLRRNSPVWAILDLDPEQLKSLPPIDGFLLLLSRLKPLLGWNGAPPAESTVVRLAQWAVKTYLPPENELKRKPEVLTDAAEAGVIHRGIKIKDETGEVVRIDVKDPYSSDFIREVEVGGNEETLSVLPKHEQHKKALDNFLDMMTERGVKISRLDRRDLDLLSDELSRLKCGMTRKEYYGNQENQRKQQLKYLLKRLKAKV